MRFVYLRFTSTYSDTGDLNELIIELTVISSTPKAIISGGDEKIISVFNEIVLDASNSFNPDKSCLENQGLVYHWSCQEVKPVEVLMFDALNLN